MHGSACRVAGAEALVASFHLNNNDRAGINGDDIGLEAEPAPVAPYEDESPPLQVPGGSALAPCTGRRK